MGMAEKVRILLIKRGMTMTELATRMDPPLSPQNLGGKLKRDNLTEKDLLAIAKACGVKYESVFVLDDGTKI